MKYLHRNISPILFLSIALLALGGCASKIAFQSSPILPAARGTVDVKSDKNNNHSIKIALSYLAEPDRLTPPRNSYVVWLVSDNNVTQNIGQIKTSKSLKVTFETVSTLKPIRIFITAEDDPSVQYPGTTLVLSTSNF